MCTGLYSYADLAKLCKAGRNTIYRRVKRLEETRVIKRKISALPNFRKLNLSAVVVGLNLEAKDVEKAIDFLKKNRQIKFVWKTYGAHDIVFMIICEKGEEGANIYNLREKLEEIGIQVKRFDTSTSITWEKVDFTPY